MTNKTDMTDRTNIIETNRTNMVPKAAGTASNSSYTSYSTVEGLKPHGGYRNLLSFQTATIIYDLTVLFCKSYMSYKSNTSPRTVDQMVQAARSGRQNIAEGSQTSATSSKSEIFLTGVARASLEELLLDYEDYLRQHNLVLWDKNNTRAVAIRKLGYISDRTDKTYTTYMQNPEDFANTTICLIHQANYLLDKQLAGLAKKFVEEGGFSENLLKRRLAFKRK